MAADRCSKLKDDGAWHQQQLLLQSSSHQEHLSCYNFMLHTFITYCLQRLLGEAVHNEFQQAFVWHADFCLQVAE